MKSPRASKYYVLLSCLVLFLVFDGCAQAPPTPTKEPTKAPTKAPTLPPEFIVESWQTLIRWLECEECTDGELAAVAKLGDVAVPSLVAVLGGGPSAARREELRLSLTEAYRNLQAYARNHPNSIVPMSEDDYVKTYMDNYIALYQTHAARALAEIGGAKAKNALQASLQAGLRDDVKTVIKESLAKLK